MVVVKIQISRIQRLLSVALFFSCICLSQAQQFKVKNDYMDVKTGAGRGYPVYTVVEKGERFQILKSKKDWLRVQLSNGRQGWVSRESFFKSVKMETYNNRNRNLDANWMIGGGFGKFGEDNAHAFSLGYYLVPNVIVVAEVKKSINRYASQNIYSGEIGLQMFRSAVVNPYLLIGSGTLVNEPKQSLVGVATSQQAIVSYGGGISINPYEKFNLMLVVKNYYLNKDNENRVSWQLGFYSSFH